MNAGRVSALAVDSRRGFGMQVVFRTLHSNDSILEKAGCRNLSLSLSVLLWSPEYVQQSPGTRFRVMGDPLRGNHFAYPSSEAPINYAGLSHWRTQFHSPFA